MNYQLKMRELQTLLTEMQSEDIDVDLALSKYEQGKIIIEQLEKYLKNAENKIIKKKLDNNS
jgi:exodeoxyribonuclease VII small subunit